MQLGLIVLRLRASDTTFGNYIGGAAELALTRDATLTQEMAFVIPLLDAPNPNMLDTGVSQQIQERFGVIVALRNDMTTVEKTGFLAYDRLHNVRDELFEALVNWEMYDSETGISKSESQVSYGGGRLIDLNRAWLWYQFLFVYYARLFEDALIERQIASGDPMELHTIYANYILSPSADLPHTGGLPLGDGFPDVELPDSAQWIDLTENPNAGSFSEGFAFSFPVYTGD
jgi:hypothetical protein